jgi:3-oxoacyl-[acyl-carrier-protein] synthase II
MSKRVVITGLGCISPVGNDVPTTWQSLTDGKSGAGPLTRYDASNFKTKIAAEVKDFDGKDIFGYREARRLDPYAQYALVSSLEAQKDAGLKIDDRNRTKIGAVIGTGIGGMSTLFRELKVFDEKGPRQVSPFMVPMMIADSAGSLVAIRLGIRGPNMAVVTACATGTNAVGEAAEIIRRDQADVMFAGGSDSVFLPVAMASLSNMTALSNRNDEPERASRPFELNRDGFVMGEGAGVLLLESLEHAQERGARILAEVTGYGSTNDAFHISAPAENGSGAAECMQQALDRAGMNVTDIDYINAHGTSTLLNDKSETAAIKTVFGEQAYNVPISSIKSMTGHMLGAAGALEAIVCVKVLQDNVLPPTINYETPDPECDLDYVPNTARTAQVEHIMSNSFGFGGHNATIIISRYSENGV